MSDNDDHDGSPPTEVADSPGGEASHPDALQAKSELEPVSARVYEALEYGIERGREFFGDQPLDPWLFPHIVRFRACERLREHQEEGFTVKQNPMSGIEISYLGHHIRVFRKCGPEEFLYPPGYSQGRQDFYDNVQLVIPETVYLLSPAKPNLAYVWEPMGADLELYLVCPDGFDSIWKPGCSRWDILIEHPAEGIAAAADFAADEEEDEHLPLELDETGSGEDPEGGPDDAV